MNEIENTVLKAVEEARFMRAPLPTASILILIPAYNEADSILSTLKRVPAQIAGRSASVLVIDDGSQDNTAQVVFNAGFRCLRLERNCGQAAALRAGFQAAALWQMEIAVTLDADGQHKPEEIERLVKPLIEDQADIVIGSRITGEYQEKWTLRHAGIVFFSILASLLARQKISDCNNGLRAIQVKDLSRMRLKESRYHNPEVLMEALRLGLRLQEMPVTVQKRNAGESKMPPTFLYIVTFTAMFLRVSARFILGL